MGISDWSSDVGSSDLEVMEESRITVDGVRHDVGRPFMVVATQNPVEQAGTYKLPEAQLDRFLMKASVGYPNREAAREILSGSARPDRTQDLSPVISAEAVTQTIDLVRDNHVDPGVIDYVHSLTEATRNDPETSLGVSTRGAIALVRAVRVFAAAQGRNYVTPDDVKALIVPVWCHRLVLSAEAEFSGTTPESVIARVLATVPAPQLRGADA